MATWGWAGLSWTLRCGWPKVTHEGPPWPALGWEGMSWTLGCEWPKVTFL